ncbi:PhnE/PtxC family ABC transporter permease [Mycoplasma simbae]|uniref:PhnE/PtxC family ABC transporter permease n=1 Tax=Mycoplasma simbae TaxID=36744 RepID=UPI0004983A75|nr:ABC transporter permease subunit [Mycoplasma simbae]
MRTTKSSNQDGINQQSTFFKYRFVSTKSNQQSSWKIRPIFKHLFWIAIIAIIAYFFYAQSSAFRADNFKIVWQKIQNLFVFSNKNHQKTGFFSGEFTNLWNDSFIALWVTIKYALVGTFIGFLFAVGTSILSFARATNKYTAFVFKITMLVLRSVPELVFITLITGTFRNELALLIVYAWFTWLWLHKYYIEILDNVDLTPYFVSINQGNSPFKAFIKEIVPRVKQRFNALFIYSFESNVRWASILGALALPGIGILLKYASAQTFNFVELGIPLLVMIIFVGILEVVNILFKKFLFEAKTQKIYTKSQYKFANYEQIFKKINVRKIVLYSIYLLCIALTIYTLATTRYLLFDTASTKEFFKNFLKPDFSIFNLGSSSVTNNPLLMFWQSFQFSVCALFICIVLTIISIRFQSLHLNKYPIAILFRTLNSLTRILPTIVLIYLFLPLFNTTLMVLIIVIGVHEMSSKAKQLSEAVDSLDEEVIANMRMQGYTNNAIFTKYVLASIKRDFIALSIFYFELIFRSSITYAIFSEGQLSIGSGIIKYMDAKNFHPEIALAYAWVGTFSILSINIVGKILTKRILR